MKKVIVIAALALSTPFAVTSLSSCGMMKTMNTVNQISNVVSTASEISNVLGSVLNLSGGQKSAVGSIFTDYMNSTNALSSLGKKAQLSGLSNLNFGTMGKLKNVLTVAQYIKLLNIGSSKSNYSSILNSVTGGSGLSSDASSVLMGLLGSQF